MNTKIGLLKIDHKEAILYKYKPRAVVEDKKHHHTDNWVVFKKLKNTGRGNRAGEQHFFKDLVLEIASFGALIMASHGKGHANEGQNFEAYIVKQRKDLQYLIMGHIATHNHRTENELLAEADAFIQEHKLK